MYDRMAPEMKEKLMVGVWSVTIWGFSVPFLGFVGVIGAWLLNLATLADMLFIAGSALMVMVIYVVAMVVGYHKAPINFIKIIEFQEEEEARRKLR